MMDFEEIKEANKRIAELERELRAIKSTATKRKNQLKSEKQLTSQLRVSISDAVKKLEALF